MKKNEGVQVTEEQGSGIEVILNEKKLREFADKEADQRIKLLDVNGTEKFLKGLVKEYAKVEVTRDNYTKKGAEAERRLRQARYALQHIHKSNSKVLNDAKREEKKTVDELIDIIRPLEERLYSELAAVKQVIKDEKDLKEKQEREAKELIQKRLTDTEIYFERQINFAKEDKDLVDYDTTLAALEEDFEDFDEFEFEAKRIHAVFTGRRSEIVTKLEKAKQDALDAKKKVEQEKEKAKLAEKVLGFRTKQLEAKGFTLKMESGTMFMEHIDSVTFDEISDTDEVTWFEYIEELDVKIAKSAKESEKKAKLEVLRLKEVWDGMLKEFVAMGGNLKEWKLKKGDMPDIKKVESLKIALKVLKTKRSELKVSGVKNEIEPFKDDLLEFFKEFETSILSKEFKYKESAEILTNLLDSLSEVTDNILGEEIEGDVE